jgi:hypothetical protein
MFEVDRTKCVVGGATWICTPRSKKLLFREKGEVPNSENLVPNSSKIVPKYL